MTGGAREAMVRQRGWILGTVGVVGLASCGGAAGAGDVTVQADTVDVVPAETVDVVAAGACGQLSPSEFKFVNATAQSPPQACFSLRNCSKTTPLVVGQAQLAPANA